MCRQIVKSISIHIYLARRMVVSRKSTLRFPMNVLTIVKLEFRNDIYSVLQTKYVEKYLLSRQSVDNVRQFYLITQNDFTICQKENENRNFIFLKNSIQFYS